MALQGSVVNIKDLDDVEQYEFGWQQKHIEEVQEKMSDTMTFCDTSHF